MMKDLHRIEYRYIIIDEQFNDCLNKKIKKFIAY